MSTARWGHAVAVQGGKLYAVVGYDGTNILATAEVYDPVTDS